VSWARPGGLSSAILLDHEPSWAAPLLLTRCPSCGQQADRRATAWVGRVEGGLLATVVCEESCGRVFDVAVRPVPADGHPEHMPGTAVLGPDHERIEMPSRRGRLASGWQQWRRERECRGMGGHWWHPADAMIAWFCCVCDKERDGMPRDGRG
jgi:hypothetical protein